MLAGEDGLLVMIDGCTGEMGCEPAQYTAGNVQAYCSLSVKFRKNVFEPQADADSDEESVGSCIRMVSVVSIFHLFMLLAH